MRTTLRLLLAPLLLTCPACYGTFYTRTDAWQIDERAEAFGWPLLSAVHADLEAMTCGAHEVQWVVAAFLGLPIDLAADVLLLPFDVVAGLSGSVKNPVATDAVVDALARRRAAQREQQEREAAEISRWLNDRRDAGRKPQDGQ